MIVVDVVSTGHSHKRDGLGCDDRVYYLNDDNNFLVFAVCDGAGSAKFGDIGAEIASESFCKWIFENKDKYDIKDLIELGLLHARKSLQDYANKNGCAIKDLGTTLSGGVYGRADDG
jgi:serine/threonine protein phosphatase PrpC